MKLFPKKSPKWLKKAKNRLKSFSRKKFFWVFPVLLVAGLAVGVWFIFFRKDAKFALTGSLNDSNTLKPFRDPLLPETELTGNYVIRYLECRVDDHLDLQLSDVSGQLYITDTGTSLQSASYTFNGWTDLDDCGKFEQEPIRPYRLYHLLKFSVARPTITESWMADSGENKAAFKRSELFFYVVPEAETWNPAGETPNPIGRPAAFTKVPAFQLKNRTYGFEYDIMDEEKEKKEELSIVFNWKQKHLKIYSTPLTQYLLTLPIRGDGSRTAFEDLTEQQCVDFADSLPIEYILAFDIEPGAGEEWTINYDAPTFDRNMKYVTDRLRAKGAMAYNWMEIPGKSYKNISLDGTVMNPNGNYGERNRDLPKYREAYARIGDVQKREYPFSLISTGVGYMGYDRNFSDSDGKGQNIGPQLAYLKAIDASELWKRVFPDKEQVYFSWAFQEFNVTDFPNNHFVEIPEHNALAIRSDNKPLYPPNFWKNNLTLGLVNAKFLFYWTPGQISWDPAAIHVNPAGFNPWQYEQGSTPDLNRQYLGKEAMAINSTIVAAYQFSLIQDAMDGNRTGLKFKYRRANKDGSLGPVTAVDAVTDGSWYTQSAINKEPFAVYCENNGNEAVLVQDVWSRPGRFTDFEVEVKGKIYRGQTEGNDLFIAIPPK